MVALEFDAALTVCVFFHAGRAWINTRFVACWALRALGAIKWSGRLCICHIKDMRIVLPNVAPAGEFLSASDPTDDSLKNLETKSAPAGGLFLGTARRWRCRPLRWTPLRSRLVTFARRKTNGVKTLPFHYSMEAGGERWTRKYINARRFLFFKCHFAQVYRKVRLSLSWTRRLADQRWQTVTNQSQRWINFNFIMFFIAKI